MDEWMREGEKYLQSSTYNKYTANRGSKQNTVVRETREGERERERDENGWEEESESFFLIERNKETWQERVTEGEGSRKMNKQVCLVSKTTV